MKTPELNLQINNSEMALVVLKAAHPDRINLENYAYETSCGTLFCALGWLARVPYFRAQGISIEVDPGRSCVGFSHYPVMNNGQFEVGSEPFMHRLNTMFGDSAWSRLFNTAGSSEYDDCLYATHKEMALNRFERHLQKLRDFEANANQ